MRQVFSSGFGLELGVGKQALYLGVDSGEGGAQRAGYRNGLVAGERRKAGTQQPRMQTRAKRLTLSP